MECGGYTIVDPHFTFSCDIVSSLFDMSVIDHKLPMRSASWSSQSDGPNDALIDRAVTATLEHPLAVEAMAHAYCHAMVMREPKSFVEGTRLPEKEAVLASLSDSAEVLLVSYWTSTSQPEPLAGGGQTFDFMVHPSSFLILAVSTGSWRS